MPSATVCAMTERHEDPATRTGRPISTGEFRVVPDASASTAQFRAFAQDSTTQEAPWEMAAPGRSVAKMALIVVIVAAVLAVIAIVVAGLG
jgi:hypothetical protein